MSCGRPLDPHPPPFGKLENAPDGPGNESAYLERTDVRYNGLFRVRRFVLDSADKFDPHEPVWESISMDPVLSRTPSPGVAGNVAAGGNLRLDIGWERFEHLLVFVAKGVLGLNQITFRRYGTAGQAQHGIDLAGRTPAGDHTVVQCKNYNEFLRSDLRAAVEHFANGKRPFGARHLIIAVSADLGATQLEDELALLQDKHDDLQVELWGAEQINDELRNRPDIVSRFWTRETAATFCTGAPLPGIALPPPNWIRVADQILLSPLGVDGLEEQLAEAERLRAKEPTAAAAAYKSLANQLAADGFTGHAHVMRRKQLDALTEAGEQLAAVELSAQLAATALHEGDRDQAEMLGRLLDRLTLDGHFGEVDASEVHHAELIKAAIYATQHPLGDSSTLASALRRSEVNSTQPSYNPLLVLLLGELTVADATVSPPDETGLVHSGEYPRPLPSVETRLADLDGLFTSALAQLKASTSQSADKEVSLRLRLLRAFYDAEERISLLTAARTLRLPRPQAALVLAAQARREALEGSVDEALEHWRLAVGHAIQSEHTDDAAGWLYAIRALNVRYGPWTSVMDEEHLLAQALPKTTSSRLIRRVRDPETDARRAALNSRPVDAIRGARRWLADSIVTGDWVDEQAATELLGDLYAGNAEPDRAATCYQWCNQTKKLIALADSTDSLLPASPFGFGPWWRQSTSLALIESQQDLLDDVTAGKLLPELLDFVRRARAGEVIDSPNHSLKEQAIRTACALAGRGTSDDAQALMELFSGDVARNQYEHQYHDKQHVQACRTIALHHRDLLWTALVRVFDLAEVGTHDALIALSDSWILGLLGEPSLLIQENSTSDSTQGKAPPLALEPIQREQLIERLQLMASAGLYEAALAITALGGVDQGILQRALQAKDRLLNRPEPDGRTYSFATRLVSDAYMVSFLESDDQLTCLNKVLAIAFDRREGARNRQEALAAASNLVLDQGNEVKVAVHAQSRAFVDGDQDGSFLDAQTTDPHPLSTIRINMGSPSLSSAGLRLAHCSAVSGEDRSWVRDQAVLMLRSHEKQLVHRGAVTLCQLGSDLIRDLDASLLLGHPMPVVRRLAAIVAATEPERYATSLRALAADDDSDVRILLARRLHDVLQKSDRVGSNSELSLVAEVLRELFAGPRHSVRRAARGLDT